MLAALTACGGGGSSTSEPPTPDPPPPQQPPFGLDAREPLAALTLPGEPGSGAGVQIVRAFPNLTFSQPLFLAQVPGEARLVVIEQGGRIKAFDRNEAAATTTTIFDISARTTSSGEQGLLGLAFDPEFTSNRFIYVHYTLPQAPGQQRRSVIARFTWDGGNASVDLSTEKIILEVVQPNANHNAGMLAFGPDGMLYIALGDGGGSGDPGDHGQNLGTLLGSLLRIDVHPEDDAEPYQVPADNPFVGVSGARPEIWAYGLRNPWRFSFDRDTGLLWLADVGQHAVEEINLIEPGGNYGWRVWEGSQPFASSAHAGPDDDYVFPIYQYGHQNGASVTGGYVYRGAALPTIAGWYVFGDFVTGEVWALLFDGADVVDVDAIGSVQNVSSFGEDDSGELYLLSYSGGTVHTLDELDPGATPPTPQRLSDTGLFTDLATLTPASGVLAYDVIVPQSADGAVMRRWLALPDGELISASVDGSWSFPVGTVLVQHLEIALVEGAEPDRRLETRLLIHRASGWQGFTYRWHDDGNDADLMVGRDQIELTLATADGAEPLGWPVPSRGDCRRCHTADHPVLGVNTRQVNRDFVFPLATDNQIRTWSHIGLIAMTAPSPTLPALPALDDLDAPIATRARAWLGVNCAHCHRPGGPTSLALDLRFTTPAADMNAIDVPTQSDNFGIGADLIVAPGDHAASMLWQRVVKSGSGRMPPLTNERVDSAGADLVREWIDGM